MSAFDPFLPRQLSAYCRQSIKGRTSKLGFVHAVCRSSADNPANVLDDALRIIWTLQVRTLLAQFGCLIRSGSDASSKDDPRGRCSSYRPSPELKRTQTTRRIGVAQHSFNHIVRIVQDERSFISGCCLYNDVATGSKIVGDHVTNENVTIDH
jgi:hypothetical protein